MKTLTLARDWLGVFQLAYRLNLRLWRTKWANGVRNHALEKFSANRVLPRYEAFYRCVFPAARELSGRRFGHGKRMGGATIPVWRLHGASLRAPRPNMLVR